jgi:hypothetical protein
MTPASAKVERVNPASTELVVAPTPTLQTRLYDATDPDQVIEIGHRIAKPLARMIEAQGLAVQIGQGRRPYVKVEGWTTMLAILGIVPDELTVTKEADGAFVATVALKRIHDGQLLTKASSRCGDPDDPPWNTRSAYARQSMAVTRATGKAARLAFSWIMQLAGYEPTPLEEMPITAFPITKAQQKRLWAIAREHGWSKDAVAQLLKELVGQASTAALNVTDYERVCEALEAGPNVMSSSPADEEPF